MSADRTREGRAREDDGRDDGDREGGVATRGPAMEVTVVGAAPSAPQRDGQGSGVLVRAGSEALLLDCGVAVVPQLMRVMDPRALSAVVITHFHADHFLDLVSLRYLLPWVGVTGARIPILLPPGGTARLTALADVISEASDFFSRALDIREYDPAAPVRLGPFVLSFVPSRHYVPGWVVVVDLDGGPRLVYTGDTGPSTVVTEAARGADLLVVEATLADVSEDVAERGHLTADEALEMARDAEVGRVLLTHLPTERRASLRALTAGARPRVQVARPGLRLTISSKAHRPGRQR